MKRRLKLDEYNRIRNLCTDLTAVVDHTELLECFIILHDQLDRLGLIKLDTSPVYDSTDIEASNKAQGYD